MERQCDAAASAQTALECSDVLRIRDDSEADGSQEEAPGTTIGLRQEGAGVGRNWRAKFRTETRTPIACVQRKY